MAPVLAYWKIRGLAQPIRLLLAHTGTEFEDKTYECGPAPDFDRSSWLNEKQDHGLDFPNLPYYIDGDVKLSQSNAILRMIARKHKLDGNTDEEKTRIDVALYQICDLKNIFTSLCYNPNFDKLKDSYLQNLPKDLQLLSDYLGKRKYIAGDYVTFVDFVALEYLSAITVLKPDAIDNFPNLQELKRSVENLPKIAEYMKSSASMKYPLNNKAASFGGK